jgi:hypothetical protein
VKNPALHTGRVTRTYWNQAETLNLGFILRSPSLFLSIFLFVFLEHNFIMKCSKLKSLLKDTWTFEIIAFVFSVLASGCLIYLLVSFNEQPVFKWHGLSLNTIVSIVSTISKTLMTFIVSAGISQWKYIDFSKNKRKLIEFDRLDSASRGPLGSSTLLWKTRFKYEQYRRSCTCNSC